MSEILRANNVSMVFGGLTAVDSVNLTMNDNEILSLIGPNGAGKTTFFNMPFLIDDCSGKSSGCSSEM